MNEVVTKVYELLMSGPEWFAMQSLRTCILGALYVVVPTQDEYYYTSTAHQLLGLSEENCYSLCIPNWESPLWGLKGPDAARQAAAALKAACEANHDNELEIKE